MSRRQQHSQAGSYITLVIGLGLILISAAVYLSLPKDSAGLINAPDSTIPIEVNFSAPDVSITDLDGNPVSFSDYSGQVILYNAWATWCPPCKEEMPVLEAYYRDYKDRGFVIIAVEDGEPVDEVRAYVEQTGLTFPVWPDLKWVASETFKIDALPTSFVIDRNGVARLTWTGAISRAMLEKYVTPIIEGN
jgi:thiol-disulfide isomerase/thioredoxin